MSNLPPKNSQQNQQPEQSTESKRSVVDNRIRLACVELENALEKFNEADPETEKRAAAENQKIKQIHSQLCDIRRQLDDLSK